MSANKYSVGVGILIHGLFETTSKVFLAIQHSIKGKKDEIARPTELYS